MSVDLDDVGVEFVDRTIGDDQDEVVVLAASWSSASVVRLKDGAWMINASKVGEWTVSGSALSRTRHSMQLITSPTGHVPAQTVRAALDGTGLLTAAAGDPDDPEGGGVVHSEKTGDFLLRITRGRVRGAALVAMPAYSRARIVLDTVEEQEQARAAAMSEVAALIAASPGDEHWRVVNYVTASPVTVGAREVAAALSIPMQTARGHLTRAADAGPLVHLGRGLHVGSTPRPEAAEVTAATLPADDQDPALQDLVASAWTAMQDLPPMPAGWFKEPTAEELPPGSGGVHYANGRVYGWVAQAGEPHAGMPGKNLTIESLGDIHLTHFLRQWFPLHDDTYIRAGAFTMGVGHHRDGAECETASCQFDDTRTVGAIVTVGMNEAGLWFSGASAPWLGEWDARTFRACQPSYHVRQGPGGRWQLRAVLSVPVPGHSSPLLASVVERSNMALAASAAARQGTVSGHLDTPPVLAPGQDTPSPVDLGGHRPDTASANSANNNGQVTAAGDVVDAVAAFLTSPTFLDQFADALERREAQRAAGQEEVARLAASLAPARQEVAAGTAGAVTKGEI
ncbi:hypothetical protein [Streptomyces sp. NPDC057509]|uniref:hypothetical protein n=1 Tax=Streptomyces sp. NPDC057509 TaxID=3346152 RepID=UPI00369BABCE